jgi:hypothetical protein
VVELFSPSVVGEAVRLKLVNGYVVTVSTDGVVEVAVE